MTHFALPAASGRCLPALHSNPWGARALLGASTVGLPHGTALNTGSPTPPPPAWRQPPAAVAPLARPAAAAGGPCALARPRACPLPCLRGNPMCVPPFLSSPVYRAPRKAPTWTGSGAVCTPAPGCTDRRAHVAYASVSDTHSVGTGMCLVHVGPCAALALAPTAPGGHFGARAWLPPCCLVCGAVGCSFISTSVVGGVP